MDWFRRFIAFMHRLIWGEPPVRPKHKISLLIPFSMEDRHSIRTVAFRWLLEYWKYELPDAEVIVGHSRGKIFCKGEALNNAARKANGDVLVIIDADTYIEGSVITQCADRILEELDNHLWFVPYRHLYRLNKDITNLIVHSNPANPLRIPTPPPPEYLDDNGNKSSYGHRYGAMIMIIPRQALEVLGCFDERFKGWGGEDIAFLRALDTLYGKHKTTDNDVLHLWHPFLGKDYMTRRWEGQRKGFGQANQKLAQRYHKATGNPAQMRALVDEGCKKRRK